MRCPKHGLEHFRVKIVKRYNMPAEDIKPKIRSRPKPGISCLYVGRDVNKEKAEKYLINYFRRQGLWEDILRMRMEL